VQFRLGSFTLDVETRQLLRDSEAIHLSPKAFELLKMLVDARPRAIGKVELHERLWPGTFVADANLAMLVAEIRKALQDDAHAPQFVRTLHGFGYAFSGAAVEVTRRQSREPAARKGLTGTRSAKAAAVSHWLIWRKRKFALAEGDSLAGRSPEASVWLDVPGVSREHARFTIARGLATLEDLGSRNGTFRGGERITGPVALRDRDRIQLGPVLMTFRVWQPGAGSKTVDLNETTLPSS
jgi:DNA-binding winged helix-turn-helix (wHTH) protein